MESSSAVLATAFGSGGGSSAPRRPQALAPKAIKARSARAPALILEGILLGRVSAENITKWLRWAGANIPKRAAEASGKRAGCPIGTAAKRGSRRRSIDFVGHRRIENYAANHACCARHRLRARLGSAGGALALPVGPTAARMASRLAGAIAILF